MTYLLNIFDMIMNPDALIREGAPRSTLKNYSNKLLNKEPLPARHRTVQAYPGQYEALSWEETRAGIYQSYQLYNDDRNGDKRPACPIQIKNVNTHQEHLSEKESTSSRTKKSRQTANPKSTTFTVLVLSVQLEEAFEKNIQNETIVLVQDRSNRLELLGYATNKNPKNKTIQIKIPLKTSFYKNKKTAMPHQGNHWRVVPMESLIKQKRISDAIDYLEKHPPAIMQSIIEGTTNYRGPVANKTSVTSKLENLSLNANQRQVVEDFLEEERLGVTVLQGPPGTGKSTAIASLVSLLRQQGRRVIITASTNKAVQELATKIYYQSAENVIFFCSEAKNNPLLAPIHYETWYITLLNALTNMAQYSEQILCRPLPDLLVFLKEHQKIIKPLLRHIEQKMDSSPLLARALQRTWLTPWKNIFQLINSNISKEDQARSYVGNNIPLLITLIQQNINALENIPEEKVIQDVLKQPGLIVCATTIKLGSMLCRNVSTLGAIDVVIADEASLILEAESLILLQYAPQKILLVGDQKQLPPTVCSQLACDKHYNWSLMERLVVQNTSKHYMLTEQYRMPEEICRWSSEAFYQGKVITSASNAKKPLCQPSACELLKEHRQTIPDIPLVFYKIKASTDNFGGEANEEEAHLAILLARQLRVLYPNSSIGIICTYQKQVEYISKQLSLLNIHISIGTVDAFQGAECDFMILSLVRSNDTKKIGFLNDSRRLNVAVTRAKRQLLIIGDAKTLDVDPHFASLIAYARMLEFVNEMKKLTVSSHQPPHHHLENDTSREESVLLEYRAMLESHGESLLCDEFNFSTLFKNYFIATDTSLADIQLILQTMGLIKIAGLTQKRQLLATLNYFNRETLYHAPSSVPVIQFLTMLNAWIKKVLITAFENDHAETEDQTSEKGIESLHGAMCAIQQKLISSISVEDIWQKLQPLAQQCFHLSLSDGKKTTQEAVLPSSQSSRAANISFFDANKVNTTLTAKSEQSNKIVTHSGAPHAKK